MTESVLAILKFVGIALSGLFGSIAVVVDYKDDAGRVTKWGRLALIGVVLTSLVAGTSAALEMVVQRRQGSEGIKRAEAMLKDIRRRLHPLAGLRVEYALRPDWAEPHFAPYFKRVEANVGNAVSGNLYFPFSKSDRFIGSEGSLMRQTVCQADVVLFFFEKPIDPTTLRYNDPGTDFGESLRIALHNPLKSLTWEIQRAESFRSRRCGIGLVMAKLRR